MNNPLILVADDDPQTLLTLEGYIRQMGLEVHTTGKSNEVRHLMETLQPATILLDVLMPAPDGFTLCRMIKETPEYAAIPVVFLTSLETIEANVLEIEARLRPDAILTKPIHRARLEITVRSMLRIHEQFRALTANNEHLKELWQFRDSLINMLAHDMRHPLQAIYGYCAFLNGSLPLETSPVELAQKIKNHAYRLNQMLQNFLDVGRLEQNKLPLFWEEITLGRCLTDCVDRMQSPATTSNVRLETICKKPDCTFEADVMLLGRVLDNLVNNAIKFSAENDTVILRASHSEETQGVTISIEDNGPGIPDEYKEKIFEKFGAVALRHTRKPSVGLGLAFCKLAVKAHAGDIWVEDHPGGGSIFRLSLPTKQTKTGTDDGGGQASKKEKINVPGTPKL